MKWIVSGVIALGMTSLIYSLRTDVRSGWDFAPADLLLLALLPLCRTMPPKSIWALALIPILSTILAENAPLTYYLAVRFAATILIISSLRSYIIKQPFILFGLFSIFISILQIIVFQSRPSGLEGNANLMGGHGLALSSFSLPVGVGMVLLSNSRGAFLALIPLLMHPATKLPTLSHLSLLKFPLLPIFNSQLKLKLLLLTFFILLSSISTFFFHGREGLTIGERGRMLSEAVERIDLAGKGWGWEAKRKEVPSYFVSSVQDLGLVLGIPFLLLLIKSLYRSPYGLAILITGLFDHYFLRSSIGYYPLALLLALQEAPHALQQNLRSSRTSEEESPRKSPRDLASSIR